MIVYADYNNWSEVWDRYMTALSSRQENELDELCCHSQTTRPAYTQERRLEGHTLSRNEQGRLDNR